MNHAEKRRFAETVARYLDAKYELGARGPAAYDCVSFIWHFYTDLGADIPDFCGDLSAENYVEKFHAEPAAVKLGMRRWLLDMGEEVAPDDIQPGDMVIFAYGDETYAMIAMARRHWLGMHSPYGVITAPESGIRYDRIIAARRVSCPKL